MKKGKQQHPVTSCEKCAEQVESACAVLAHYHCEHTEDTVTRFRGGTGAPDIYVIGDPQLKVEADEFFKDDFGPRVNDGMLQSMMQLRDGIEQLIAALRDIPPGSLTRKTLRQSIRPWITQALEAMDREAHEELAPTAPERPQ